MRRVLLFYWLSGFVSLGYQVFWFRFFVDAFGSTNLTFVLVLCNFIGGLAAGAVASQSVARRLARWLGTDRQLRLYGAVELLVVAAVLLTLSSRLIPANAWGTFPYQEHGGIFYQNGFYQFSKLLIGTLCVFTPCFFMGVTFPLLCDRFREVSDFPATLYAWNTCGACSGVVFCQFVFLPTLGHNRMLWILWALNLLIGVFFLRSGHMDPQVARPTPEKRKKQTDRLHVPVSVLLICAILSGALTGALEADMFKRLSFLAGDYTATMSFISFWAILSIFLSSWTVKAFSSLTLAHIKVAYLLAGIYYFALWKVAYPLRETMMRQVHEPIFAAMPKPLLISEQHTTFPTSLGQLFVFVGLFVFVPFYLVSLLLPYICNRIQQRKQHLGLAYGLNTLAFCIGIVTFTWLAPLVNVFYSMKLFMVMMFLGAGFLTLINDRDTVPIWKPILAGVGVLLAAALTPRGFDATYVLPNSPQAKFPVRRLRSNAAHTTYVTSDQEGDYLCFDNHLMSGTNERAQTYMRLMAHFPLLAQSDPKDVLLICFGVGNTASAIAKHESIQRIDAVDLNTKVMETAPEFADWNDQVYLDPRLRFIHDDGRNFLKVTDQTYDLVTSEPPPPLFAGVYRLYSREYYQDVLNHLKPQGMMTQWLPIYQMPPPAVELIIRTFVQVFPHNLMFVGYGEEYILLGSKSPIDLKNVQLRIGLYPAVHADLERIKNGNATSLLARVVRAGDDLQQQVGKGPTISDAKNDLAQQFVDPLNRVSLRYHPSQTLAELSNQKLANFDELQNIATHLGRLTHHVRDFPGRMFLPTALSSSQEITLSDLNWRQNLTYFRKGFTAMTEDRLMKAIGWYQKALGLSAEQPKVWFILAQLYQETDQIENAVNAYQRFLSIESEDTAAHMSLGQILLGRGKFHQAQSILKRTTELAPSNAMAHCYLGYAYQGLGNPREGRLHFDRAVELAPNWPAGLNGLALHLVSQRSTDRQERQLAVRLARRANKLSSGKDVRMLGTLAEALAAIGRYDEAVKASRRALALPGITATEKRAQDRIRKRLTMMEKKAFEPGPGS